MPPVLKAIGYARLHLGDVPIVSGALHKDLRKHRGEQPGRCIQSGLAKGGSAARQHVQKEAARPGTGFAGPSQIQREAVSSERGEG